MRRFSDDPPEQDLTVRKFGQAGAALALTHYVPGGRQDRHEHDHAQISFLVAGSARETIGRTAHDIVAPGVCIKPTGADHENLWGTNGAFIVSARLADWGPDLAPDFPVARWVPFPTDCLGPVITTALLTEAPEEIDGAIDDVIALLCPERTAAVDPPAWLRAVAEAVRDSDAFTAEEAARLAGVHRVHLSRCFARHYGVPFGVYRKRVMVARAMEKAIRSDEPLADVAHCAGFADQSHMHRSIASLTGVTPRRFRSAFQADAIPV